MNWLDLFLFIPLAAVLAVGVWAAVRRKWLILPPAVVLGLAALSYGVSIQYYISRGAERLSDSPAHNLAMTWLLASAATLVCWVAVWAGYSRGHWFWRSSAMAGVLALLALIEANEPILLILATMPFIAGGAYLLRQRQDRGQPREDGPPCDRAIQGDRFRWSLRDAFLGFVVIGLLGVALRSVATGELYLVGRDFAVTSLTLTALALTAAGSGLARKAGARWASGLAALILVVAAVILHRSRDGLGVAYCFYDFSPGACIVPLAIGTMGMTAALVLICNLYSAAARTRHALSKRISGVLLAVLLAAVVTPLALVYPRMLPPAVSVAPSPPSATYAKIQAAGQKAAALHTPGFQAAPVVKEATKALAEPGNVWFDAREFRNNELSLSFDDSFHRESMLCSALDVATAKAEETGRFSESLKLAILQWRLGRVLRRGGIVMNWAIGNRAEQLGCAAVSYAADRLSEDECRLALVELRRSLT
ncbi:MAG: hypothetical protein KY475_26860, partial [Planctomycetes bacterium]|nr:hypothetical protein [Planctomycetota bacterium]